VGIVYAVN